MVRFDRRPRAHCPEAALGLLVLALSGACATLKPAPLPLASYVLLGESPGGEPVAFARVVLPAGQACPALRGHGEVLTMTKRRNPHGFEVDVCEAVQPFERSYTVGRGGPALPVARRRVGKVAVLGDTGCKPKDQAGYGLDDPAWAFPALARAAAARRPDLVLHVGDYNYRGTPAGYEQTTGGKQREQWYYDAGDGAEPAERCELEGPYSSQNSSANQDRDAWQAWWLDFFQPAAPLLAAAPWVAVRGNHELCSHAGPGWFYFLDTSSQLAAGGGEQLACPSQDGAGPALPHLAFVPPRVVALDGLELAVLDSANACDELPNFTERYAGQLAAAGARLAGGTHWLLSHRPVWAVEGKAGETAYGCDGLPTATTESAIEPGPYGTLNRTLQCAFAAPAGKALLPRLDLVLTGHLHRFEALRFAAGSGRPPSLVAGNGGVAEDTGPPLGSFRQLVDGVPASGFSLTQFGFLELARADGGSWRGTVVTPDPAAWSPDLAPCPAATAEPPSLCAEPLVD